MNQILSIFLPGFFALYTYKKLINREMKNQEYITGYFNFTLLINIMSFLISIYVFRKPDFIFTNVFTVKYLCLSSVIGLGLSFIIAFIEKNVEINIKVEKK